MSWRECTVAIAAVVAVATAAVVVVAVAATAAVVAVGVTVARLAAVHTGTVVDYSRRRSNALTFRENPTRPFHEVIFNSRPCRNCYNHFDVIVVLVIVILSY